MVCGERTLEYLGNTLSNLLLTTSGIDVDTGQETSGMTEGLSRLHESLTAEQRITGLFLKSLKKNCKTFKQNIKL